MVALSERDKVQSLGGYREVAVVKGNNIREKELCRDRAPKICIRVPLNLLLNTEQIL